MLRPKNALTDAEAALELDKNFHDAMLVRGKALAEMGLNTKAREVLEGYLELAPENDEACSLFNSLEGKVSFSWKSGWLIQTGQGRLQCGAGGGDYRERQQRFRSLWPRVAGDNCLPVHTANRGLPSHNLPEYA